MRYNKRGRPRKLGKERGRNSNQKSLKKTKSRFKATKISSKRYNRASKETEKSPTSKYEFYDDLGDKIAEFRVKSPATKDIGSKSIKLYDVYDLKDARGRARRIRNKSLQEESKNITLETSNRKSFPVVNLTEENNESEALSENIEITEKCPPKLRLSKELESQFEEVNDYCHVCIDGGNIILCDS